MIEIYPNTSAGLTRYGQLDVVTPELLGAIGSLIGEDSPIDHRLDEVWEGLEAERIVNKRYPPNPTTIDNFTIGDTGFYINASEWSWGDQQVIENYFISFVDFLDPDFVQKKVDARLEKEAAEKEKRRVKRAEAKARKIERDAEAEVQAELDERAEYRRLSIKYHALT